MQGVNTEFCSNLSERGMEGKAKGVRAALVKGKATPFIICKTTNISNSHILIHIKYW